MAPDERTAYGGPPTSLKHVSASAAASDVSAPVRYEGALREFSSKLPERGSFHKYNTNPWRSTNVAGAPTATTFLRLYRPPTTSQTYSASHTNVTETITTTGTGKWRTCSSSRSFNAAMTSVEECVDGSRRSRSNGIAELINCMPAWSQSVQHSFQSSENGTSDFRTATVSLEQIEASCYAQNKLDEMVKKSGQDATVQSMIDIQDETWDCFVEGDKYMDEVKKYNASNFIKLVKARNESHDTDILSRYEHQIRACVREPDSYTATWELLESLCVCPKSLIRHITSESFMDSLPPKEQANVLHLVSVHAHEENTASTPTSVGATMEELTIEDEPEGNGEDDVQLVLNPADVGDDSSDASICDKCDDEETQSTTTSTAFTSSKNTVEEGTESSDSTGESNSNSDED